MKILMVNKFLYPRGGSESYMLKLSDELKRLGHEVEFFGMYDEQNTVGNSLNLYTGNMDFHSKSISRFLYPFKIVYSGEAYKKIGKVLNEFQPDVVHMNNINFQLTPSIIYAVKKRNIPLVQTVHDYQMICPNHLLYSFGEAKPCDRCVKGSKWNCFKHNCIHDSKIKSLLGVIEAKFYSFLKTYKKVDLFICPSKFLESKLLGASPIYSGKTFTIHNFIEKSTVFTKAESTPPYVAFVGRLSKEKGVELLAGTASLLPDVHFVVAGNGPDDQVLKNIPNVILKGFVGGKDLTTLMSNAKLLIAPSVCYENNPLSILEAHSMGVPVVTMNYGGMKELVDDGFTGVLAEAPTPQALAAAVKKCFDDEKFFQNLKANCETIGETILDVTEYCKILIQQYDNLLNRKDRNHDNT